MNIRFGVRLGFLNLAWLFVFAVAVFVGSSHFVFASSVFWTGSAGDGNWETPANWNGGSIPTALDDVSIGVVATVKINGPTSINSLNLGNSAGGVASVLVFNYDGISSAPLSITNDLTVYSSSQVTHTAGTTTVVARVNLSIGGNATISGSINSDGKGFYIGQGPGAGQASAGTAGTGGSYGGLGAVGDGPLPTASLVYGSLTTPTDLGSGGGRTCNRGASASDTGLWGGGAIKISVTGTTAVNGSITSNGSSSEPIDQCWNPGSGSGGSVYLTTGSLLGNGTIAANGGSAGSYMGGSGGRIAIYYTNDNSTVKFQTFGGSTKINGVTRYAGAGTIFKKSVAQANGDLTIDNNNLGGNNETVLGLTPITANIIFANFNVKNSASVFLTIPSLTVANASITGNAFYDVLPSTVLNYSSLNWTGGMLQDSGGTLAVLNQNQDLVIPAGSKLIFNVPNAPRTYTNLTVSGILTHAYNDSAVTATSPASLTKLNWAINGNLVINAGGSVNADGKGYRVGQGLGSGLTTTGTRGTGGSYGGLGAVGDGPLPTASLVYGSLTTPTDLGSGGGRTCNRGFTNADTGLWGGGAIQLVVLGSTTINGTLSANGSPSEPIDQCWDPGSGAGGSVYLTTGSLLGNGTIAANGGGSAAYNGGSGGRVAVYYTTDTSSLNYQSFGGGPRYSVMTRYAGAGTIYKKSGSQTSGDVVLNNNGLGGNAETVLGFTPLVSTSTINTLTIKNSASSFLGTPSLNVANISIIGNGLYDAKPSTALTYAVLNWTGGMLQDSGGTLAVLNQNQDLVIPVGSKLIFNVPNAPRTYTNLTVSGILTHWNNDAAVTSSTVLNKINWSVTGNLTIPAGGSVNADGKGYHIGQGPGAAPTTSGTEGSGGSYGGLGGYSDAVAAPTSALIYGSLTAPTDLGSGGGRTCNRGASASDTGLWGGGAIQLTVSGTTTINGTVSANGSPSEPIDQCWNPGGGSGGSVYIVTTSLAGNGLVNAQGGTGVSGNSGGGGGGRISILANSNTSTISKNASGGQTGNVRKGADGTVNSNGGSAFVPGSLSSSTSTDSSVTVAISGASDPVFGLASSPYTFYNVTRGTSSGATSSMAWLSSGLAPNTQYSLYAKVYNNVGNTVTTSSVSLLTMASLPDNLSASLSAPGQAVLVWEGNSNPSGTEYLAFDVNDNSDSGWGTSTVAVFSGLSCDTTYSFQVKARNNDKLETAFSAPVNLVTQPCNREPDIPTALGPASSISGSWIVSDNPSFSFMLSDPDAADLLKYKIQISDSADFSNPAVDFTSDLQNKGLTVFNLSQPLADSQGGYYWRVKAIDSRGQASDYAVANGGSVAFKVDGSAPQAGFISLSPTSASSLTATIAGAADAVSGLAASAYVFTNQINGASSGAIASSSWISTGLAPNTQYAFSAQVTDTAGNSSNTEVARLYTPANQPTGVVALASNSQITVSWDTNNNPASTEYMVLNTLDNTNSGWGTSNSAIFTGLACNTRYSFQVKARNADMLETSYTDAVSQSIAVCSNPLNPSNLGPDSVITGGWISTGKPGFIFTLSDPDVGKTLKFRIQVATSPDFSKLILDYTSGLQAQGATAFTVGQEAGNGAYSAGSPGQTLADSSSGYYWRVMATNNLGSSSSYVSAHGGEVAFRVDSTAPMSGTLDSSNVSQHTVKIKVSGAGDTLSGLIPKPYVLKELTTGMTFAATAVTSWEINKLDSGVTYQFQVYVTDTAGNTSFSSILSVQTKSNSKADSDENLQTPAEGQPGQAALTVLINGGASSTTSSLVTLTIVGSLDATQMTVSNLPFDVGTPVEPLSATVENWDLCARTACTSGSHIVNVSFFTSDLKRITSTSTSILLLPSAKVKGAEIKAVFNTNLRVGSNGDEVLVLQSMLSNFGYLGSRYVTGYYGYLTSTALGKLQSANGIVPTGALNPTTRRFLNGLLVR